MQPMHPLQPQNARRRGPKLAIPLDGDVASVRYYKCPPKKTLLAPVGSSVAPPQPAKERAVNKTHLKFIPPSMRRPSPLNDFLIKWLDECEEEKKASEESAASLSSTHDDESAVSSCGSSSGASSGDTVTTDFSSISSPRKAPPPEDRVDRSIRAPQPSVQHLQPRRYPYRVPRGVAPSAQLTPGQWAELLQLQQSAIRPMQYHPPPKLLNIHTAYLPGLDAAVLAMMQPSQQHHQQQQQPFHRPFPAAPFVPRQQQWQQQQHGHNYTTTPDRSPQPGSSTGSTDSAHESEDKDRSQQVCSFCYQHAVHDAHNRGGHLPRLTDRGGWRGHAHKDGFTIVCPRLLRRVCSLCGATGQSAHQTNYCPATKRKTANY